MTAAGMGTGKAASPHIAPAWFSYALEGLLADSKYTGFHPGPGEGRVMPRALSEAAQIPP